MSTTVLGKVSITPKGAWSASTSYEPLDVVSYGGSAFLARRANSNVTPTEGADWQMIAEKATVGNIAQTTGDSTELVMSQKAVTKEINNVEKFYSEFKEFEFNQIGYYAIENVIHPNEKALNTGYCIVSGYTSFECECYLTQNGYVVAFFNEDKNFISGVKGNGKNTYVGDIPSNAFYAIFSLYQGDFDQLSPYAKVFYKGSIQNRVTNLENTVLYDSDIVSEMDTDGNIFDITKVKNGYEVYGDGSLHEEDKSVISDFIYVRGKKLICFNNLPIYSGYDRYCYFYDADKNPIGTVYTIDDAVSTASMTIPQDAYYFVFSIYQRLSDGSTDYSNLMVSFDDVKEYVPISYNLVSLKGFVVPKNESQKVTNNKKMLVFGDSITETATMDDDGNNYKDGVRVNWLKYAASYLQTTNYKNYAMSGAAYKDRDSVEYRQNLSGQIALAMGDSGNDDAEIVIVSLGTNDGSSNIGSYETAMSKESLDALDRTNLYEALRWAMWTLRNKYTNAKFFVGMPIQRASNEQPVTMLDAIKNMANRYNFIIIDATNESGIIREFETSGESGRYLYDGLHPNEDGSKLIAKLYSNVILRNFIAD